MINKKYKKGFTLVEVLVVVLIIGVLAAIAVPSYKWTVEKTRATQGITSLTQIAKAQYTYNAKSGNFSKNMLNLPLEMKDDDGSVATGDTFSDQYFDYKIFGDRFSSARATRNNGEYELSVDYSTGQVFCRPITHKICRDFGLPEGQNFVDTSNIQNWVLKDYILYIMDELSDMWDNTSCGNDLHCIQDKIDTLCTDNGEGTCLNNLKTNYVIGADGYKYYWQTWYASGKTQLVFEINDYAARPFFAMVFFNSAGVYLQGNRNHSAGILEELAAELGLEKQYNDNGDWVYYRLKGYNNNN